MALLAAAALHADDTALVKAAKKVPPGTAITNETVNKDAGANPSPTETRPATAATAPAQAPNPAGTQAASLKRHLAAEKRLHDAEAVVAALQNETDALELSYYYEDDPDVRDRKITHQFALAQAKLEAAGKELAAARADLAALPPLAGVTVIP